MSALGLGTREHAGRRIALGAGGGSDGKGGRDRSWRGGRLSGHAGHRRGRTQGLPHLARRGEARCRVESAGARGDAGERGVDTARDEVLLVHRRGKCCPQAAEHEHHAQRVDIAADARLAKAVLLGRRVRARTEPNGIRPGIRTEAARDAEVDERHAITRHDDVPGLEVAMDDRRVKRFVKLRHRLAKGGHDAPSELIARAVAPNQLGQALAGHVLAHHDQLERGLIALDDTWDVQEPSARALRAEQVFVDGSHARIERDALAHERTECRAVCAHEAHELGHRPVLARTQPPLDSIVGIALERAEIRLEVLMRATSLNLIGRGVACPSVVGPCAIDLGSVGGELAGSYVIKRFHRGIVAKHEDKTVCQAPSVSSPKR